MRKLLMLGGAFSQIPAIKRAKEMGYYVITCDYLPDNPGHRFSDEYVNISTVDREKVLQFAIMQGINGISAYASDPAAETAAYVAGQLNLPGTGWQATKILSNKDLFREFQKNNGFNYPQYFVLNSDRIDQWKEYGISYPCMVKPVDSSGSKGVHKVTEAEEMDEAIQDAFLYGKAKRVIVEEYICSPYKQIHGDGFVYKGKLIFLQLGDQNFKNEVPIGTSCPSFVGEDIIQCAKEQVEKLIRRIKFETGAINVEIRIGDGNEIYIIEIGPRSGGNYVPELMEESTGFDEVTACIAGCMGDDSLIHCPQLENKMVFQYIIGAPKAGIYQGLWFHEEIQGKILRLYEHKHVGDIIQNYKNSSGVIGVALIGCTTEEDLKRVVAHIHQYVKVLYEEDEG